MAMIISLLLGASACGEKAGITSDDHARIEVGMTMDEVEDMLGQPERSHVTGDSQNPSIFWYYPKAEGDGLVKVSFEGARVTSVSPYDQSFEVGE
ncbi:MAG: hypothetical protein C4534_08815 [Gaiellales bacterium]|nr:MAG: hypothetical protein C4534_08815 [Gaiellales bacterium]